jgi:hypothetical protein
MEFNDYGNAARNDAVKAAVEAESGVHTIWLTRNFTPAQVRAAVIASNCTGILLEGEIPAEIAPGVPNPQAVNWPEVINQLSDLDVAKGVVTNFAPFVHHDGSPWPEMAAPLIADGWACVSECYDMSGDPTKWIERRDFFAKQVGWYVTQPALGVYGGRTLDDFPTRNDYPNWSVWSADYLL